MKPIPLVPELHFFVCANAREPGSPLGAGCGEAGKYVYSALKNEVAKRAAYRDVWVTETKCLGVCPKRGATVAVYPARRLFAEVEAQDATSLFERELAASRGEKR